MNLSPLHGDVVVVVVEGREGVLEDVRGVGEEDEGEEPLVHPVRVVHPLRKHGVLHLNRGRRRHYHSERTY